MNSPTQPSPYGEIKRSLTDFHIALEACRQRAILDRALAALGAGKAEEASRIIKELSNSEAKKGHSMTTDDYIIDQAEQVTRLKKQVKQLREALQNMIAMDLVSHSEYSPLRERAIKALAATEPEVKSC